MMNDFAAGATRLQSARFDCVIGYKYGSDVKVNRCVAVGLPTEDGRKWTVVLTDEAVNGTLQTLTMKCIPNSLSEHFGGFERGLTFHFVCIATATAFDRSS